MLFYLCQEQAINVNRLRYKKQRAKALIEQHQAPDPVRWLFIDQSRVSTHDADV